MTDVRKCPYKGAQNTQLLLKIVGKSEGRGLISELVSNATDASLGLYPEVPVDRARSRHLTARQLLAEGVDPSLSEKSCGGPFD